MYIDISQPPAPLPVPSLTKVSDGISLLEPLSRKGSGPGLVLLCANTEDNLGTKEGVPSLLKKWAEEGYAVVEVQERAVATDENVLSKAIAALAGCNKCEGEGTVGLIAYVPGLWNAMAPKLSESKEIVAAVVYTDVSNKNNLTPTTLPRVLHLAGKVADKTTRTPELTEYEYPAASNYAFATPFQESFNYSAESVSHTRNLTFLKKLMNGPFFDLEQIWDEHTYFEFENRSVEHTMATMIDEPYVNHVPTLTGGIGRDNLSHFYANNFIFKNAEDTELELISRTVGIDRIVDEFIFKFTHTTQVDWLIPGIPPTGKSLEIPFTAIVNIRGDRLYHEHIAWDQGTVLAQLGLLPQYLPFPYALPDGKKPAPGKQFEYQLPVLGIETAQKIRDKNSVPSNGMFEFGIREV